MKLSLVSKNTLALLGSQIYARFTGAFFLFIAARILGAENFGSYTLVLTLISFFYILSDWGMSTFSIRETSKNLNKTKEYLLSVIPIRLIIAFASYILMIVLCLALNYPKTILILLFTAGLSIFSNTLLNAGNAVLSAHEKMHVPSILGMIFSTLYVLLGTALLMLKNSVLSLMILLVLLNLINLLTTGLILKKYLTPFKLNLNTRLLRKLFLDATPYAVLSALSIIYFRVDTIILSKLRTMEEVGLYNAVYKIVEFLTYLPTCYMGACFPKTARQLKTDTSQLKKDYLKSTGFLLSAIIPIAIIFTIFSKHIVTILFGQAFINSAPLLQILIWAVVFMYLNAPIGNIVNNSEKIYKFIPYAATNTALNIVLNIALIPKYGAKGAAITTLFTEITGLVLAIYLVKKFVLEDKTVK